MGKREVEMVETITRRDLPREFTGTYETPTVWNEVGNHFEKVDMKQTKWISHVDFKFRGFMKLPSCMFSNSAFDFLTCFQSDEVKSLINCPFSCE